MVVKAFVLCAPSEPQAPHVAASHCLSAIASPLSYQLPEEKKQFLFNFEWIPMNGDGWNGNRMNPHIKFDTI